MADRRSVTRRMCRSSTKEVTCTSPRISKLYMAYEQINEGLPGALEKIMRKTWAPRAQERTQTIGSPVLIPRQLELFFSFDSHDSGGMEQTRVAYLMAGVLIDTTR